MPLFAVLALSLYACYVLVWSSIDHPELCCGCHICNVYNLIASARVNCAYEGTINLYTPSGSGDGTTSGADVRPTQTLTGHTDFVRGLALSTDGQVLVSASHVSIE